MLPRSLYEPIPTFITLDLLFRASKVDYVFARNVPASY